ncbi:MAG: hypothetical protein JNL58_12115 [Planctomyces sp.]|nr:hypothetical protein [Planctomyces sp.]
MKRRLFLLIQLAITPIALSAFSNCFIHAADAVATAGVDPVAELRAWVEAEPLSDDRLKTLVQQDFAGKALTKEQASEVVSVLWTSRRSFLKQDRAEEVEKRELQIGELKMPFWYKVFGEKPESGRSLFISMHGGGGAPARVNDSQYENQKRLYQPEEGVYLVPRAPTNTWNLWHEGHIDDFFERLIVDMIAVEDVNPNRIYIMGYSAGGDGVYQLAPRMADRLAAAAMMAGHPNETQPDGLRNIGFTLHMGGLDAAYSRNAVAEEWKTKLADLQTSDPDGYKHFVQIHEGKGHWMDREDAVAVPWMAQFNRNAFPQKIVWLQDDIQHSRFYWIAAGDQPLPGGQKIVVEANRGEQRINILSCPVPSLVIRLHDGLMDLDKPVSVYFGGQEVSKVQVTRTTSAIATSLLQRSDPATVAYSEITVEIPK